MTVHSEPHYHVWITGVPGNTGSEYANAIFENNIDASLAFLGMAKDITKYGVEFGVLNIETVVNSLEDGRMGMFAGTYGMVCVLSKCKGNCTSPSWN